MSKQLLLKIRFTDKDIPQVSVTNIGAYTMETEGEFVIFGTHSESVFEKWLNEVREAGIWFES